MLLKTRETETIAAWRDFPAGRWQTEIDVRDFIQASYKPYKGDASFLAGPTERTSSLFEHVKLLMAA